MALAARGLPKGSKWGRDPICEKVLPPATLCWDLEAQVLAKVKVAQDKQIMVY